MVAHRHRRLRRRRPRCAVRPRTGRCAEAWIIVVPGRCRASPAALMIPGRAGRRGRGVPAARARPGAGDLLRRQRRPDRDRPDRRRLPDPVDLARDLLDQRPGRDPRAGADGAAPTSPAHAAHERIDWRGAVLVAVGMGLSRARLRAGPDAGAGTSPPPGPASSAGSPSWSSSSWSSCAPPCPLIKVRIFRDRAFVVDNARAVLLDGRVRPGRSSSPASTPRSRWATTPTRPGLYLLVFFAGFAPAAQVGGRMLDTRRRPAADGARQRAGPRRLRAVGRASSTTLSLGASGRSS